MFGTTGRTGKSLSASLVSEDPGVMVWFGLAAEELDSFRTLHELCVSCNRSDLADRGERSSRASSSLTWPLLWLAGTRGTVTGVTWEYESAESAGALGKEAAPLSAQL